MIGQPKACDLPTCPSIPPKKRSRVAALPLSSPSGAFLFPSPLSGCTYTRAHKTDLDWTNLTGATQISRVCRQGTLRFLLLAGLLCPFLVLCRHGSAALDMGSSRRHGCAHRRDRRRRRRGEAGGGHDSPPGRCGDRCRQVHVPSGSLFFFTFSSLPLLPSPFCVSFACRLLHRTPLRMPIAPRSPSRRGRIHGVLTRTIRKIQHYACESLP